MGDEYTTADIATYPWVNNVVGVLRRGFDEFVNVKCTRQAILARPAIVRGLNIPTRP